MPLCYRLPCVLRGAAPLPLLRSFSSQAAAAPPFLVDMLRAAKWRTTSPPEDVLPLAKEFEFKNERLTSRFLNDLSDACLRNRLPPGAFATARVSPTKVAVSVPRPASLTGKCEAYLQDEVDTAQIADAVAAELQLGGGWN